MKKLLLLLCLVAFIPVFAHAGDADLFKYDKGSIESVMSDLNTLEAYLVDHQDATMSDLIRMGHIDINGLSLNTGFLSLGFEPPLGIPSFLWGCVFGWVGLLVVYLVTDEDKAETKKALYGCIISTVAVSVFYVVYVAVWATAASSI